MDVGLEARAHANGLGVLVDQLDHAHLVLHHRAKLLHLAALRG